MYKVRVHITFNSTTHPPTQLNFPLFMKCSTWKILCKPNIVLLNNIKDSYIIKRDPVKKLHSTVAQGFLSPLSPLATAEPLCFHLCHTSKGGKPFQNIQIKDTGPCYYSKQQIKSKIHKDAKVSATSTGIVHMESMLD